MFEKLKLWQVVVVGGAVCVGLIAITMFPWHICWSAKQRWGIRVPQCPSGKVVQQVAISGSSLSRGAPGHIEIRANALYTTGPSDEYRSAPIPEPKAKLLLVDAAGKETPLEPTKDEDGNKWRRSDAAVSANVELPAVPDGDYKIRARVVTEVGESSVDMAIGLYAPARVHVITDRPLYEPGNVVQFRAVVMRARDLSPIDNRPGTWIVKDPQGTKLLEEKAPSGSWGVIAGNFPLDSQAATGDWTVSWQSASSEDTVSFRVEPFTLPRFRVDASPDRTSYRAGDQPKISGQVVYSSGAPVANASLDINWVFGGAWQPPQKLVAALEETGKTDATGRFELAFPEIPADLLGRVPVSVSITATDPAGDRVSGGTSLLLAEDGIQVEAITDLEGGLVEGFNNRMYVRVTTADGTPLPGAQVTLKKAWAPTDPGIDVTLDEDSVARVQIDPGKPVTVVIPPMPIRAAARAAGAIVSRTGDRELVSGKDTRLEDRVALDKWLTPLKACAKWVTSDQRVEVVALVGRGGRVIEALGDDAPLSQCTRSVVSKSKLPAGPDRLFSLSFNYRNPRLPTLSVDTHDPLDDSEGIAALLSTAALDARDCLPSGFDGELPWRMSWKTVPGKKTLAIGWLKPAATEAMPAGAAQCIASRVGKRGLQEPAKKVRLGYAELYLSQAEEPQEPPAPQPTTMLGYELLVSAKRGDDEVGQTRLRMRPGTVPRLRLRAQPVLAQAGQDIDITMIRGPSFSGKPPKMLYVHHEGKSTEVELPEGKLAVKYKLPDDAGGWYEMQAGGERALVFVRSESDLTVSVTATDETYAPGATAELQIRTRIGESGAQAAVGLFGVDNSLSQLAKLPGPDDMRRVRPDIAMAEKAFGVLDGQALTLGRIRGSNAAEATILRVQTVPTLPDLDAVVSAAAETPFDPVEKLTDRFYAALVELHSLARVWERTAPAGEVMEPKTMAKLWKQALDSVEAKGGDVTDAFGRRLRLHRLPSDLLALTDPRQVVVVGTRLPEDVENWADWVARKKP